MTGFHHVPPMSPLAPRGRILRMLADTLMINVCLLLALALRFTILVGVETPSITTDGLFRWYLTSYLRNAWVLSTISLLCFTYYGFYSYGRAYQSRYKFWMIVQGVSISFLAWGAIHYVSRGYLYLPRGAFLLAWGLTLVGVLTSRLWTHLWRHLHTPAPISSIPALFSHASITPSTQEKTILLVGGAGYIGSALTEILLARNYRVRILDLLIYGTEPIEPFLTHPNLEIVQADFRQIDQVLRAMQGIQSVVHLGGIVGDPACAYNETLTLDINVVATNMIAEIAKKCGVSRFVFASTCSVYGTGTVTLDEQSQLNPVSLYARTKIASEQTLHWLADDQFSPTSLRFGTLYGFSGRIRFDLVVNLLTARAILDGSMTIYGGDQWRPLLHVQDAAHAVVLALEAPRPVVHNQIFNVGSNAQNYTIHQIAQVIQQHIPQAILVHEEEALDRRNYRVNFDKIEKLLHFQPAWTLSRGIQQITDTIRSGRVTNYHDPRYSNIKFLQEGSIRWFHPADTTIAMAPSVGSSDPPN